MRIISGIQPTGSLHIGNYVGAIRQWLELQEKHECIFFVADLHGLTVAQDPTLYQKEVTNKMIEILACGISPDACTLFVQSSVPEHTELTWIFNTLTPLGELERMTQFKDKSKKNKENINAGLLVYPTLMAADILLYKTEAVPVGQDQTQHLELTRTIAQKFNAKYGETFPLVKSMVAKEGAKIMSLQDPKKKMSKSDGKDACIGLFDEPQELKNKILKAVTDTGKEIIYDLKKKPGISNLLTLYSLFSNIEIKEAETQFKGKGYSILKNSLAELLENKLAPIRAKKKELESRDLFVQEIVRQGQKKAGIIAQNTMREVREKVGLSKIH